MLFDACYFRRRVNSLGDQFLSIRIYKYQYSFEFSRHKHNNNFIQASFTASEVVNAQKNYLDINILDMN